MASAVKQAAAGACGARANCWDDQKVSSAAQVDPSKAHADKGARLKTSPVVQAPARTYCVTEVMVWVRLVLLSFFESVERPRFCGGIPPRRFFCDEKSAKGEGHFV